MTTDNLRAIASRIVERMVIEHPAEAAAISRLTGLSLDQFKFVAAKLQMLCTNRVPEARQGPTPRAQRPSYRVFPHDRRHPHVFDDPQ